MVVSYLDIYRKIFELGCILYIVFRFQFLVVCVCFVELLIP